MPQISYHDDEFELRTADGQIIAWLNVRALIDYRDTNDYDVSHVELLNPFSVFGTNGTPTTVVRWSRDDKTLPVLLDAVEAALHSDVHHARLVAEAIRADDEYRRDDAAELARDYRRSAL